jgi:ABC-type multidrug transport system permease subunit
MTLGAFSICVTDISSKKIAGLIVTRTSKIKIVISYILSAWFVGTALSLFFSIALIIYLGIATGIWLSFATIILYFLILLGFSVVVAMMIFSIVSLIKTTSGFGAVTGIGGTVLAFLCGIFMPYSIIGSGAQAVGSLVPSAQMSATLKGLLLNDIAKTQNISQETLQPLLYHFGGEPLGLLGFDIPTIIIVLIQVVILSGFVYLASRNLKKKLQ